MPRDHVSNRAREQRMVREALAVKSVAKERAEDRKRRKADAAYERSLVRQALAEAERSSGGKQ